MCPARRLQIEGGGCLSAGVENRRGAKCLALTVKCYVPRGGVSSSVPLFHYSGMPSAGERATASKTTAAAALSRLTGAKAGKGQLGVQHRTDLALTRAGTRDRIHVYS